ncbi:MAG: non-ribosomal peptide synthetase [Christensenellales bacterium]
MSEETNRIHSTTLYPLSNSQMNIWKLEQSLKGTAVNNICETVRIKGRVDIAIIQQCLNLVVQTDPSLRTRLIKEDERPMQYYAPYSPQQYPVYDFSSTNHQGVAFWERAVAQETMQLLDSPLYYFAILKLSENEGGVLIKTHHIISDGWSQVILINRFGETYLRLLTGQEHDLSPLPAYFTHIEKEQKYLTSSAFERDKKFWDEQTAHMTQPISFKDCQSAVLSPVGQRVTYDFPEGVSRAIYAFCTKNRVAPFAVFYMALAIYLNRLGNTDRFSIGVPIHNRLDITERKTTGMFVSTLPFFGYLDKEWNLEQFNLSLSEQWLNILRHQRLPYDEIVKLAKKHQPETNELFHIVLDFQDSRFFSNRDATISFTGQWNYAGYQLEDLCIHLNNMDNGRQYSASYCYLTQLFCEKEIENIHHHLMVILSQALASPQKPLYQISLLGFAERDNVLFRFNKTESLFLADNLDRQFCYMVEQHGDRVAVIENNQRLSYSQLDEKADFIAAAIQKYTKNAGRVAVFMPKGNAIVETMLGIIRSGNAWILLPPDSPAKRLEEILLESEASLLIATRQAITQTSISINGLPVLIIDELPPSLEKPAVPEMKHSDTAYIVFTSGSTGKPKGVEISHGNLLNFTAAMASLYPYGAILSLCGIGFDVFIMESMVSLLSGHTVIFPQAQDTETPAALARLIRNYAVGFLCSTPSRLSALLKHPEFGHSLKRVDTIVCGGEAFPGQLLQALKGYTSANIYNQYGPSETTIGVSYKRLNDASAITVGKPMAGCRIYILDQYQQPLPVGVFGQVYIGGQNVGKGYYNQPELTKEKFFDSPFETGERMYASGDMGCWTPEGELILKGRIDRQVKLRGLRIELDEIASRLSMHPGIHQAVAHVFNEDGRQTLAAYYTADQPLMESELLEFTATYLPEYMIPACFIHLQEIPLTANGKLDISRLPSPQSGMEFFAEETDNQRILTSLFRQILKKPEMTPDSDYFHFGGDSLNALETLAAIERETGVTLRIADLYACRTARKLEQRVFGGSVCMLPSQDAITPAPDSASYPLLPIQQSIYVQWKIDPTGLAYNMPGALRLPAGLDRERLLLALCRLVQQEEVLRTYFEQEGSGISQKIAPDAGLSVSTLAGETLQQAADAFIRPFDLGQAPLLRAGLWEDPAGGDVLFIDMHHIIGDGLTTPILLKKIDALYNGQPPVTSTLQYKDYACWYHKNLSSAVPDEQRQYWQEQSSAFPAALELPLDSNRTNSYDFKGEKHDFSLDGNLNNLCREYCKNMGISPYMLIAGTLGILLSRLSHNENFLVGSPVSGRRRREIREMPGAFINTLPLQVKPQSSQTISSYFESVRRQAVEMLDNQDVPFEEIVAMTSAKRSLSRNPLYDVLVAYRPVTEKELALGGLPLDYIPLDTHTAKVDLSWEGYEDRNGLSFHIEYARPLFAADTIAFWGRSFVTLLQQVATCPKDTALHELNCLSPADRLELWEKPNHMRTPFVDLPVDMQIDYMAMLNPDAPAIRFHGETMTFAQCRDRSDALAEQIIQCGAKQGDIIGILCRRSPDLLCAMIAICKAGCAYLPLLASFPQQRLQYMLENAQARMVLCDTQTQNDMQAYELPCPVTVFSAEKKAKHFVPVSGRSGSDLIHVLYTSGSTGKPKGVMLTHSSIANLLGALSQLLSLPAGNVLCTTNLVFDTFIAETLLPLALGKCVVIADEEEMMLPYKIADLIDSEYATVMQLTPSRLQMCLGNKAFYISAGRLELMILAGEALSTQLLSELKKSGCRRIVNLYGPTEAAVYVTMADLTQSDKVTIGRPLANCRAYILDKDHKSVLPTSIGELYLAGSCLSKGYINQPELTAASFLDDPFFPGEKMYRSGDIGRLLHNGELLYLGRHDSQVKLNGQRIELSEISGAISSSMMIGEVAVVPVKQSDSSMVLTAFIVPKDNSAFDLALLKHHLASQLPQYMIPSQFFVVDALPKTATGKADLQTLVSMQTDYTDPETPPPAAMSTAAETEESAPDQTAAHKDCLQTADEAPAADDALNETVLPYPLIVRINSEKAAGNAEPAAPEETASDIRPLTNMRAQLLALWKETLHKDTVQEEVSFFDQGGSSLGALSLLSNYFNNGWTMTLAQFYDHPTLAAQSAMIEETAPSGEATAAKNVSMLHPQEISNKITALPGIELPAAKTPEGVLLTGATGFLGAHLLKRLIETGKGPVVCLVRGGNAPRLNDTLCGYFSQDWTLAHWDSIQIVPGDISLERFGMEQDAYDALAKRVGLIVHAAADVRHYANDTDSYDTNYQGTANIVSFAWASSAALMHVSTISVSGEYIKSDPAAKVFFTEDCEDIGQNWQDNIYVRSKFLGEQLVLSAIQKGLQAKVFRIGRLVGRDADGAFQKKTDGNTFYHFINGLACLDMLPRAFADFPIEMTPVDFCARALVALIDGKETVYHLCNPRPATLDEVAAAIKGYSLPLTSTDVFQRHLNQLIRQGYMQQLMILLDAYNRMKLQPVTIEPVCEQTQKELLSLGIHWPKANIRRWLRGFLEAEKTITNPAGHQTAT